MQCIDLNAATSYTFDSCFDLRSRTVFLTTRRNIYDTYSLSTIKVSYFDTLQRQAELVDIPQKGARKVYYLSADKNPRNLYIELSVEDSLEEPICELPRRIFVKDCELTGPPGVESGSSGQNLPQDVDLRTHFLELETKEEVWKTACKSIWDCSEWGACYGGIQKRTCEDVSKCFVTTDAPETVRYCLNTCVEDWSCTWSSCTDGVTTPTCVDRNSCGTTHNKPAEVPCNFQTACNPQITCGAWSSCSVDYAIADLKPGKEISQLPGVVSRLCEDQNGCVGSIRETKGCSAGVDVYTRKFIKCNTEYIDLYNRLDGQLLARVETGTATNPRLNIKFDNGRNEEYCDYCYNGILDGDEREIDCGGSCGPCLKEDGPISLASKGIFRRIKDWFSNLF